MLKYLHKFCCCIVVLALLFLSACDDPPENGSNINKDIKASQSADGESGETGESEPIQNEASGGNESEQGKTNTTESSSDHDKDSGENSEPESGGTQNTPPVHTHSYTTKTVAATCTAGGYTLKTCSCGISEKTNPTSARGHSFGGWTTIKPATQSATGLQRRTCSRCGETEDKILNKLPVSASTLQQEILRLVNEERAKQGLAPLQYYVAGQSAADVRAQEIKSSFSHTRPGGQSCFTALDEANIEYYSAGENIASGYPTPQDVMNGWMNSPGHRANILNEYFTHLIVGVNGTDWVQLFIGI